MTAAAPQKRKKPSFWENQKIIKKKAIAKKAHKKRIPLNDLTLYCQQLSAMIEAGLPLVGAMSALEEQIENPYFKVVLRDVRRDVASGNNLSSAAKKFPKTFPPLFISMVEAGEASGQLGSIMGKISIYFEETVKLNKKVKGALTYPLTVIGLAAAMVVVLMIFVIPIFSEMFTDFGAELPRATLILIGISNFLKHNILFIAAGCAGVYYLIKRFLRTPKGRLVKDKIINHGPIIRGISKKVYLSRFCRTYSILTRSGVPILQTLDICKSVSNNTYIEAACKNFSKEVSKGGQLSDAMQDAHYFPPLIERMARAGEQAGNVEKMMDKIADFYDVEVETSINSLTSLMEPLFITVLGLIIGAIVMAMFLPIFKLSSVVAQ